MAERQKHGFDFEEYVETNYGNVVLSGEYGSRWDGTVRSYSGVEYPLSLKTCKNTSAIPLSDVFRNASVDEDFVLTVGFWKDVRTKKPASIHSVFVEHQVWHTFFDHETLRLLKERDIYDGIGNSRSPEWKKRKNWLLSTWDSEIVGIRSTQVLRNLPKSVRSDGISTEGSQDPRPANSPATQRSVTANQFHNHWSQAHSIDPTDWAKPVQGEVPAPRRVNHLS